MQSLRATLWNNCPEKKLDHISENVRGGRSFIESYDNVLLEAFARKNVSFRVTQPTPFSFSQHYSACILLVNQYDLTYIL